MESNVITDDEEAALRIIAEALMDPSATANPGGSTQTGQRRSQDGEVISKSKGRRRPKAAKPRTSRTSKAPQSGFKGVYSSNFLKPGEQKWQARGALLPDTTFNRERWVRICRESNLYLGFRSRRIIKIWWWSCQG